MDKSDIAKKTRKDKYIYLAIVIVFAFGIFLRTYHFHDWLRFNADQGRDSELVSSVVEGKAQLPLLGPKAGGTTFKLGPMFYYFEIASAKIFGNYPDRMAYPDLLTSILCIPLLYFFLRKYFDVKISLAMSAIFSVSEFAIRWARFAWNPNSTPFWTLLALYAIHEVVKKKNDRKYLWSIVAGIAVGVGVQLHTMLLLFFPITLAIVFGCLFIKKNKVWKYFFVIFSVALFLNIPQFIHEYSSQGENIKSFFIGIGTKQGNQHSLPENFIQGNSNLAQIIPNIIGGYEINDNFKLTMDSAHYGDMAVVLAGAIFALGGLIIAIRFYKKEEDADKKAFLAILAVYTAIAYIIFIKLAFTLSVRIYLVLFFIPYFLLGFWLQFFREKMRRHWMSIMLGITLLLMSINLFFVKKYFNEFASYSSGNGSVDISTLGELEKFSQFIVSYSKDTPQAYISGDKKFFFINYPSIKYLAEKSGIELLLISKNQADTQNANKIFYIARENKLDTLFADPNYIVTQDRTYGKFTILLLEKK